MAVSVFKRCLEYNFIKNLKNSATQSLQLKRRAHVVVTDDCSTVVCWHPEKKFPYEMSSPIPEKIIVKSDSVLKVQSRKELLSILRPKKMEDVIQELTQVTHTTKHAWYPRKKQFRRKKHIEMNRPYL